MNDRNERFDSKGPRMCKDAPLLTFSKKDSDDNVTKHIHQQMLFNDKTMSS